MPAQFLENLMNDSGGACLMNSTFENRAFKTEPNQKKMV